MGHPGVHASIKPDHPAIIMAGSGETVTYRRLDERTNRLAHLFRAQGLRRGDHVALFMENNIRFMEVVWGALRTGLYITAINSFLTTEEVEYVIDDCDARLVISSRAKGDVAGAIDPATTPEIERWLMTDGVAGGEGGPAWEPYEEAVAEFPSTPVEDQEPGMYMLYSSGTTGRPKGIKRPLPEHHIDELDPRTADFLTTQYDYNPDMVYLSPAPLYHAAPLAFSNSVHRIGGTLVIMEKSELVREALGEHIFEWFVRNKRHEWWAYKTQVTPFERDRYLRSL